MTSPIIKVHNATQIDYLYIDIGIIIGIILFIIGLVFVIYNSKYYR